MDKFALVKRGVPRFAPCSYVLYTLMPKILKCFKKSEKILTNTTGNAEYFDA